MLRKTSAMQRTNRGRTACAVLMLGAASAIALPAQTFTTLLSFNGTDGAYPTAGLIQATNGDFYGTTFGGGAHNSAGTVFKMTPNGKITTVYSFCSQSGCPDGGAPNGALVQAANGDFYGTTAQGGNGYGTVFKITPAGTLTTLHSFVETDGSQPYAGLILATNGDFYGTTWSGGAYRYGTVFRITPAGTLTTIYSFCKQTNCTDGAQPFAALIQASDGDFYGTTQFGGNNDGAALECNTQAPGCGTVYKLTPGGKLTTLYSFCSQNAGASCTDGDDPVGGLVQAANGNLYGTTWAGGPVINGLGQAAGTIFQISTTLPYNFTSIYAFCSQPDCPDGGDPYAALIQATDGNLYGTTQSGGYGYATGGQSGGGTMFAFNPNDGYFTLLHTFCSQPGCADGANPVAPPVQDTNGTLYGATDPLITSSNPGTVFSLSMGLAPFVEPQTISGRVGAAVTILGNSLTGATRVTFNGTAAVFTVNSVGAAISTTVPAGATSGSVQVVTARGVTLSSDVSFTVVE